MKSIQIKQTSVDPFRVWSEKQTMSALEIGFKIYSKYMNECSCLSRSLFDGFPVMSWPVKISKIINNAMERNRVV
jgi:hypothetical protein